MLKGRFFQALQPKWQCKLGAPKVDEWFNALYMIVHERQKDMTNSISRQTRNHRDLFSLGSIVETSESL